jgi:hypothetical protein
MCSNPLLRRSLSVNMEVVELIKIIGKYGTCIDTEQVD